MLRIRTNKIRIGDTARFPLGRLGSDDVYRHRFEVYAFTRDGCAIVRRLHDGLTRTVSMHWLERYLTDDCYRSARADDSAIAIGLETMRASRVANVRRQLDPSQPGFYVSARHGQRFALLLGPFTSLYDARQLEPIARRLAQPYDTYCEYAYGTCRAETSERVGKFNPQVFEGVQSNG